MGPCCTLGLTPQSGGSLGAEQGGGQRRAHDQPSETDGGHRAAMAWEEGPVSQKDLESQRLLAIQSQKGGVPIPAPSIYGPALL